MSSLEISELDRFKSNWTIQEVLCSMSELKSIKKKDGSGNGHVLKFEFKYGTGIVKVCAFDLSATYLCPKLKINKSYLIFNGRLQLIQKNTAEALLSTR